MRGLGRAKLENVEWMVETMIAWQHGPLLQFALPLLLGNFMPRLPNATTPLLIPVCLAPSSSRTENRKIPETRSHAPQTTR